ncbi:MAG TPA: DNA polymerase III subunit beta [Burkholderiaceae bacterium]|nr:DNA polymerase III subunit beta [Burkholderiaceae bacterium]
MDVTINREVLARELGLARRLAERKATLPVHRYALLDARPDGEVFVSANDGDAALTTAIRGDVNVPGRVLVPVAMLHEMARAAMADAVQLRIDGTKVAVRAGGYTSKLQVASIDDYQPPPAWPVDVPAIELSAAVVREAFIKTRFVAETATKSGLNYYLHGALLRIEPDRLEVVTTDGRRLAHVAAAIAAPAASRIILPRRGMDDLLALLGLEDVPETVRYARDNDRAFFDVGHRRFVTRVIDAQFPRYERVVPPDGDNVADIERDVLVGALRRVMLVATDTSKRTDVAVGDNRVTFTMRTPDVGDAEESVPALVTGAWASAFDAQVLAEFLAVVDAGAIRFNQESSTKAAKFVAHSEHTVYTYVAMPMVAASPAPAAVPAAAAAE